MNNETPLAERMRPKSLDDFIGQSHLIGEGQPLRDIIKLGRIPSMIFWGPPGVGKTTLANIIAKQNDMPFFSLSAINSGVKEIREVIQTAKARKSILFIDEIHRFSKSQQDSLLGAVEKGIIVLIGATTENPSFEVISALLSRCQVYILKDLNKENLTHLIDNAIKKDELLKEKQIDIKEYDALFKLSGGDGRKLLNVLEITIDGLNSDKIKIDNELVLQYAQQKMAIYDKAGEQHYDIVSAFIKSIRGSDPNAAVYWLARMVEGGEDPKFIARRLLILSSEDIGNANPTALVIANNCFQAVQIIGYPECDIILSQTVTYLASSPKSNASYKAIKDAKKLVKETGDLSVPLSIRNAPTGLMKDLDYGKGYKYAHDYNNNFIEQEFLPDEIKGKQLYNPGKNVREEELRKRLKKFWKGKYGY